MSTRPAFLEDLIDACVMECYFRGHMAERDLLFHATVAPHLAAYSSEASAARHDGTIPGNFPLWRISGNWNPKR